MPTYKIIAAFVVLGAAFSAGWQSRSYWDLSNQAKEQAQQVKQREELEFDLNGTLSKLASAREEFNNSFIVIDKEIVKYVKSPHTVCDFDSERVRIKREAVEAANAITRPDGRAVQSSDAGAKFR